MQHKKKVHKVPIWQVFILRVLIALLFLWYKTLKIRANLSVIQQIRKSEKPHIFVLWHNCLFSTPLVYNLFFKPRKLGSLISSSKDGAILSTLFSLVGIMAIRGSSSFRGSQAAKEVIQALRNGYDIGITPDGPRGPRYSLAKGFLAIAEKTQTPLTFVSYEHCNAWRLNSWDKFYIPKPFSKIKIQFQTFESYTHLLEAAKEKSVEDYVKNTLLRSSTDLI